MNILDTKISTFKSTTATEVINDPEYTIGLFLTRIQDGTYKEEIEKLRNGDTELKRFLPTIAFHGIFDNFRQKKDFNEASGIIILDIDNVEIDELEEIKEEIIDTYESVLACFISPSGDGIKILYYIQPELITAENYRQIGKQVVEDFEIYGNVDYLSVTDCVIMTYDPNIKINSEAVPAFIHIKDIVIKTGKLEALDDSKTLWTDAEDFFDTVLDNNIAEKTNNNFHYIQVAMLDLAKFGFYHPAEDLSFVVDYSEIVFGQSTKNQKRFLEVAQIAMDYPQIQYPYRLTSQVGNEEDDEYIDYTEYQNQESPKDDSKNQEITKETKKEPEEDFDGFIKIDGFFERIYEVIKEGDRVGAEISLKNFADIFRFRGTGICTITGIPGHGKTEFVDACTIDLARLYGQDTIIAGFEQTPEEHVIKLMRKMIGKDITNETYFEDETNMKEMKKAYNFITSHFHFIDTNKTGGNINLILQKAAKRIQELKNSGRDPRYIILDPFNMLSIKGKFSGHEKIEEILRRLSHFSKQMNVMVLLVAHPFKMRKNEKTDNYEVPDFYSVKGSSAFFEMSYHGLVVYREGYTSEDGVLVRVLKVKQNNLGNTMEEAYFKYDRQAGRYIPIDEEGNEQSGDQWDFDWLHNDKLYINKN